MHGAHLSSAPRVWSRHGGVDVDQHPHHFAVCAHRTLPAALPPDALVRGADWGRISEILVVGFPVGLTFFLETGVFSFITLLIATLGDAAVAAHQIAINVWDVFYIPMISVGSAMATRMGHAIGARNAHGVRMALWVGAALSTLIGLLAMSLLLLFPDAIIGAYTQSEDIRELALRLLRLAALFIMIDVVQIVDHLCFARIKRPASRSSW